MKIKNTADLIIKLKAVKEECGYSCQDILDMVEAKGEHTSLSSIRRVFAEGSEEKNFRYEDVIKPIASALLMDVAAPDIANPHQAAEYFSRIEALETAVEMKNARIAELEKELAVSEAKLSYAEKANNKTSRIKSVFFGIIAIIFLLISSYDVTNGAIGFIKYETIGAMEILLLLLLAALVAFIVFELFKTFKKEE